MLYNIKSFFKFYYNVTMFTVHDFTVSQTNIYWSAANYGFSLIKKKITKVECIIFFIGLLLRIIIIKLNFKL
jgi:hypothetical protein